jgi:phenylpropionate dioxygenase-like ring-hydroxylating dioxygenase large terminal subunit
MKSEDYSQGEAFQAEKRTVFSAESLPLCAAGQLAKPGDFVSATIGGWGVVAVRDREGAVRVLRNACRHQNMQVVGAPAGNCEAFRCRFHGWTYDLQGRFLSAPPPVAPRDAQSPDLHMAVLPSGIASSLVFFSLAATVAPVDAGPLPAYGGTLTTEIACNWKVCVEHLLAEHVPSPDFTWAWPLLAVRRAGSVTIIEQIVPHTFLRTRLLTHVFGQAVDDFKQSAGTIKHVCENLQADRAAGKQAVDGALVDAFHRQLGEAYARDGVTT